MFQEVPTFTDMVMLRVGVSFWVRIRVFQSDLGCSRAF